MNTLEKPTTCKEGNILQLRIKELNKKIKTATEEEKIFIEKDIRKYENSIKCENKIINTLLNCKIPMYILKDLNIKYKDYKIQIDFLLITKKKVYILESKNTYGNIVIDNNGNFYRTYYGKKISIYNPIKKLDRNIDTVRMIINNENDLITKLIQNKPYDNFYNGIVVLSNENTIINTKQAPRNIKNKVVRLDRLVEYIKKQEKDDNNFSDNDELIKELSEKIVSLCIDEDIIDEINETEVISSEKIFDLNEIIKNKLKNYRNYKSKELNYKPYFIFNDKILNEIVRIKPYNEKELKKIKGFSEIKYKKYGKDILKIINGK